MEDLLQNKSFKTSIPFLSICPTFEPSPYYKTMLAFLFQFLYLSATAGTTRVGMDVGILGGGRRHRNPKTHSHTSTDDRAGVVVVVVVHWCWPYNAINYNINWILHNAQWHNQTGQMGKLSHIKSHETVQWEGGGGGCCICCLVAGWPRSCFIFSGLKRPVEVLVVCHGEVDEGEGEEAGGGVWFGLGKA